MLALDLLAVTKQELVKGKKRLKDFSRESLQEIQAILKFNNYYQGRIDGLYGPKTQKAFANFKRDRYLAYPELLGFSTLKALALIAPKNKPTTKLDGNYQGKLVINYQAGRHTGRNMRLPTGELVYSNELIIPKVPLTWGEVTKNCTRVPHNKTIVKNLIFVAKQFGKLRHSYGAPLKITSGYRPPHLRIGSRYSQHKLGLALDIFPYDRNLHRYWQVVLRSNAIGIGDGRRKGFVHTDWRRNGQRVIFNY